MLDVKRLQVLLSVVELGSVTAAAESLMYTPSAVSQQLRRLEREVGQPLMRRHARGMVADRRGPGAGPRTPARCCASSPRPRRTWREVAGLRQRQARPGHLPHRRQLVPAAGRAPVPASCTRRSAWTSSAAVNPSSSSGWRTAPSDLSLLWDYAWRRLDATRARRSPSCSTTPPCCWWPPTTGSPAAGGWPSAELADEDWIVRCDHPVVEVLRRAAVAAGFEPKVSFRANDYQEAQAMVGHRSRHRAGPAHRGAEPAA